MDSRLTRIFFSWMNTLGAEMTQMLFSFVVPFSSCFANVVAVSSEYYM
jgi:hypothetical protein